LIKKTVKKYLFLLFFIPVVSLNNISYSQDKGKWSWFNPLPQGNGLSNCSAVDSLNCWACGSYGTIIHTSDGGKNWEVQRTGITGKEENFHQIVFLDLNKGFVVDRHNGIMLKTTDGGKTWEKVDIPQGAGDFYDLKFIDNTYGWLATESGKLYFTEDRGETWRLLYKLKEKSITSLFFFDRLNGWATVNSEKGEILKTTNGGAIWQSKTFPELFYIRSITFLNNNTGLIYSSYQTEEKGRRTGVFFTTDGGEEWMLLGSELNIRDLYPLNENEVLVAGGRLYTINLNNWSINLIENKNGFNEYGMDFSDPLHGWIVGSDGAVIHTSNGGKTWNEQIKRKFGWVYDIYFTDKNNGWLLAAASYYPEREIKAVLANITNDGEEVKIYDIDPNITLRNICFVSENTGFSFGYYGDYKATIFKLTREGNNLKVEETDGMLHSDRAWGSLFFRNKLEGWFLNPYIEHTTDGGKSWEIQYDRVDISFKSCMFVDSLNGWAVGITNMAHTTDGGKTWEVLPSPGGLHIEGSHFVDKDYGWVVGSDIYKTTDGGRTWEDKDFMNHSLLDDVMFVNRSVGYVMSIHSEIYKTTDGGDTWFMTDRITNSICQRIFFTDEFHGWAVSTGGSTLKYSLYTEPEENRNDTVFVPYSFSLYQNYPNPFNNETTIKFSLPEEGYTSVKIYNILGEEVRNVTNNIFERGLHSVMWDGRDNRGKAVSSGVYIMRLTYGEFSQAKKILLIK